MNVTRASNLLINKLNTAFIHTERIVDLNLNSNPTQKKRKNPKKITKKKTNHVFVSGSKDVCEHKKRFKCWVPDANSQLKHALKQLRETIQMLGLIYKQYT